jgi:hypothetical protein
MHRLAERLLLGGAERAVAVGVGGVERTLRALHHRLRAGFELATAQLAVPIGVELLEHPLAAVGTIVVSAASQATAGRTNRK